MTRGRLAADGDGAAGPALDALIAGHRAGFALPQPFYRDEGVFRRDVDRVLMRHWLCVGHESRVPGPGDYFLHEVAGESVIVARGTDGALRALLNV
ncbi:MAG: aromatic ring-hydroxylating dioxygenase subunit alpha, partial [Alphaproteobacteria bacterium]